MKKTEETSGEEKPEEIKAEESEKEEVPEKIEGEESEKALEDELETSK